MYVQDPAPLSKDPDNVLKKGLDGGLFYNPAELPVGPDPLVSAEVDNIITRDSSGKLYAAPQMIWSTSQW